MNIVFMITTLVLSASAAPKPDCNCKHLGSPELNSAFSGSTASGESSNEPSVNFVQYSQPQPPNSYNYQNDNGAGNGASLNSGDSYGQFSSSVNQGNPNFGSGDSVIGNSASYGQSSSSVGSFNSDSNANQENNNYNSGFGNSALGNGASYGSSLPSSVSSSYTSDSSANQGSSNFNFGSDNSAAGQSSSEQAKSSDSIITNADASAAASVTKQLYFFEAPHDDDDVVKARYNLPPLPPKKNYKIIFIKAPTYKTQATINIPAPSQNDEKTLVYVLVKKPELDAKVQSDGAALSQPTKPEVFFIKYKTQKEAQDAVAQIQGKYGATGQVIANLPASSQVAFQTSDEHIVQNPEFVNINSVNGVPDGNQGASQKSEAISSSDGISQSSPSYASIGQSGDGYTYSSQNSADINGSNGSAGISYQVSNGGGQQDGSGGIVSGREGTSTTDSSNCDQ